MISRGFLLLLLQQQKLKTASKFGFVKFGENVVIEICRYLVEFLTSRFIWCKQKTRDKQGNSAVFSVVR